MWNRSPETQIDRDEMQKYQIDFILPKLPHQQKILSTLKMKKQILVRKRANMRCAIKYIYIFAIVIELMLLAFLQMMDVPGELIA